MNLFFTRDHQVVIAMDFISILDFCFHASATALQSETNCFDSNRKSTLLLRPSLCFHPMLPFFLKIDTQVQSLLEFPPIRNAISHLGFRAKFSSWNLVWWFPNKYEAFLERLEKESKRKLIVVRYQYLNIS